MYDSVYRGVRAELEKSAVLGTALWGAASHLGTNLGIKLTHNTGRARRFRARQLAHGIRRGISGERESLKTKMGKVWAGPELWVNQDVGAALGSHMRDLPRGRQIKGLKKLRKAVAMNPALQHAPVFEDTVAGVNRVLANRAASLPKPGPVQADSWWRKALPYAAIPVMAVAEPASLAHAGVNVARRQVAKSHTGRTFMTNAARDAASAAMNHHPFMSSMRQGVWDTVVSPAALNSARAATALTQTAMGGAANPHSQTGVAARRLAGAVHTLGMTPSVRSKLIGHAHDVMAPVVARPVTNL